MPLCPKAPGLRQCWDDGLRVQLPQVGVSAPHSMTDSLLLARPLASGRAHRQQEPSFPTRAPVLASSSPLSPATSSSWSSQSSPSCSAKLGRGSLPFLLALSPPAASVPCRYQPLPAALGARASSTRWPAAGHPQRVLGRHYFAVFHSTVLTLCLKNCLLCPSRQGPRETS